MKNSVITIIISIVIAIFVTGCASFFKPIKYSVEFNNIGKKIILLDDVSLYESKEFSTPIAGKFCPGQRKSSGPFYQHPKREYTIAWTELTSKKKVSFRIRIRLPKLFYNKVYSSEIIFYIDSDKEKLYVAYRVFDPVEQDFKIIDSKGNPFDIKKKRLEQAVSADG